MNYVLTTTILLFASLALGNDQNPLELCDRFQNAQSGDANGNEGVNQLHADYADAVGLLELIKQIPEAERQQAITKLKKVIESKIGRDAKSLPWPNHSTEAFALADTLSITVSDMQRGTAFANSVAGTLKKEKSARKHYVPSGAVMRDFANIKVDDVHAQPIPVIENRIYYYEAPNVALSPAERAANIRLADIADQLAARQVNTPNRADFFVHLERGDAPIRSVRELFENLVARGHQLKIHKRVRAADFMSLKTKTANKEFRDIPLFVRIKTGMQNDDGTPTVIPALHSEMVIEVRGPWVNAKITWFQGVGGTGFFPADLTRIGKWTGELWRDNVATNFAAFKLLDRMVFYTGLIELVAAQSNLIAEGYCSIGVCNTSTSFVTDVVEQGDRNYVYPSSINRDIVERYIGRFKSQVPQDHWSLVDELQTTLAAMPDDHNINLDNPAQVERILLSFPWKPGDEPFAWIAQNRQSLERRLAQLKQD